LSSINFKAVKAAAVDAIHALAQTPVIGVPAGPDITGLRASSGLLVGAGHGINSFLSVTIL
jgi:hypothetical protein